MSKKSEKMAFIAFPSDVYSGGKSCRRAYKDGYEQAEKNLALTWEDIALIDSIILDTNNEMAVDYSKKISRQKFYEEVLKRFNKQKNGQE